MNRSRLNVPQSVRPGAEEIVSITDAVCGEHLDHEYAALCREVVAKLGRKRPSPLTRGDRRIWAAGVVYAVGQRNFLFDPTQTPHATADQLSEWLAVKKTSMANKARMIRDTLDLSPMSGEFIRQEIADASPLNWLLELNGMLIDIRYAPAELQVEALQLGLITHLPDQPPTTPQETNRLVEVITTDCYNLAEQLTAFYEVFNSEVALPATATLVGSPVDVTSFDVSESGQEVTAECRRSGASQSVQASELVFPPDAPSGWIHAAYRHCLGLEAHPSTMPAGWQPAWL